MNKNSLPQSIVCAQDVVRTIRGSEEIATDTSPAEETQELNPFLEDQLHDVTLEVEYTGPSSTNCSELQSENRKLKNQVKSLQNRLKDKRKDMRKSRSQGVY